MRESERLLIYKVLLSGNRLGNSGSGIKGDNRTERDFILARTLDQIKCKGILRPGTEQKLKLEGHPNTPLQWNPDLTKYQGTSEIGALFIEGSLGNWL